MRIYASCAIVLAVVLALEVWVVSRHIDRAKASTGDRVEQGPDGDARPLPTGAHSPLTSHIDPRLSEVATTLGRGRADVRCWSIFEWDRLVRELDQGEDVTAYTTIDTRRVQLPGPTCGWLHVSAIRTFPRFRRAEALASFAHELEHLRGIEDEARAECYSHQHLAALAEALGANPEESRRLGRVAWREFYPPADRAYVSPQCTNGGQLDLHPGRRQWP